MLGAVVGLVVVSGIDLEVLVVGLDLEVAVVDGEVVVGVLGLEVLLGLRGGQHVLVQLHGLVVVGAVDREVGVGELAGDLAGQRRGREGRVLLAEQLAVVGDLDGHRALGDFERAVLLDDHELGGHVVAGGVAHGGLAGDLGRVGAGVGAGGGGGEARDGVLDAVDLELGLLQAGDGVRLAVVGGGAGVGLDRDLEQLLPLRVEIIATDAVDANLFARLIRGARTIGFCIPASEVIPFRSFKLISKHRMCAVVDNWIDSHNALARHYGALRVIRLIGDRSCLRLLAPLCIQGGIALNENLILRLIERSVATVLAGAPAQENLALRSLKILGRKNVSVSVLCVESTVNRRLPVRGSIRVILYAELLIADVIRIQHNIGTDFRIEVEQLVGIIPLFTRACRPTDKLHTIDFNGFT